MMGDTRYRLDPHLTTWHITFGTYGTRLHGDGPPTVDRRHNHRGEAFIWNDRERSDAERGRMRGEPIYLTDVQRCLIEETIPALCERGGWLLRVCAAQSDHVHILLDIKPAIHGEKVRRLIKRWLGQAMDEAFGKPASETWWAEEGSNRAVKTEDYLNQAHPYVAKQRITPSDHR